MVGARDAASGGMDRLFGQRALAGLAAACPGSGSGTGGGERDSRRLEMKPGYGVAALDGRFASTPESAVGLSGGNRQYALLRRLRRDPRPGDAGSLEVALEASRQEGANDNAEPVNSLGLRPAARR